MEVVHQYEEDIVVFDHDKTNVVQTMPREITEDLDVLSLELHPAWALDVDLSNNPECRDDLDSGYFAIAKNSWAEAAIKFQKLLRGCQATPQFTTTTDWHCYNVRYRWQKMKMNLLK